MFSAIILLFFLQNCESSLKFFDEFNGKGFIDESKWSVEHEVKDCNGNYINQLNCKTNDKNNLRVIEGTLALAAIRQKHANKFYTSPKITTKESFKYGRFVMRAALPKGKMLRPIILLEPITTIGRWPKNGQIEIMFNTQTSYLRYGIHFIRDAAETFLGDVSLVEENLNEFNTYILDWTQTEFKFIFNERVLYKINITKELENNYNPFSKAFKLSISLGIGGFVGTTHFFPGQTLYESDVKEWNCSLLIFDYIRIYDQESHNAQVHNLNHSQLYNVSSSQICDEVMPTIREEPKWELVFNDEFNGTKQLSIDQDKWNVQNELDFCDGNYIKQIHCKTNNTRNVRLSDGTLILAAIREKYSEKEYTSALITTKESFTYGRFEIRAALPEGKMLRPAIYLEPNHNSYNIDAKEGLIDIVTNTQSQEFYYGTHLKKKKSYSQRSHIRDSVFQFHTYVMEWTETEIRWFYDKNPLIVESYQKELSNDHHFFDKPFKLTISLGVGGKDYFPGLVLNDKDADEWPCSLLILDYVRVFQLSDKNISTNISELNQMKSFEICQNVMPFIRRESKSGGSSLNVFVIISITSLLLLLAIIPLIIIQFIRMKKIKKSVVNIEDKENTKYYEIYSEYDQDKNCEFYENVYEMVDHSNNNNNNANEYTNTNEYVTITEDISEDISEEMRKSGQQMALYEQNYEIMTNKILGKQ